MVKNYSFYRCYLERGTASEGAPGLLAATEVVQAVCDAGFQRNGLSMISYPSSPHCYYKFAKPPKEGMYMIRAVKMTDMTTLDILIDTRMYPNFVMIENNPDWQELADEVKDTLEQMINDEARKYNWNVNLQEHHTNTTQYLEAFFSVMSYITDPGDVYENRQGNVQIGQVTMKIGDIYFNDSKNKEEPTHTAAKANPEDQGTMGKLKPLFYNNEDNVWRFLKEIDGMPPNDITDLVNQWVKDKRISDYGNSRKGVLWGILNEAGLYMKSRQNWNRRVY